VVKAGPKYELLATNPVGEVLMATPAIAEGALIVRGLKHVFAIGHKGDGGEPRPPRRLYFPDAPSASAKS